MLSCESRSALLTPIRPSVDESVGQNPPPLISWVGGAVNSEEIDYILTPSATAMTS